MAKTDWEYGDVVTHEDMNGIGEEINANTADRSEAELVPFSLVPGPQIVDAPRASRVRNIEMDGRTLVNLLGRDGNFETTTGGFTSAGVGATLSRNSSTYKLGAWSLGVSATASGDAFAVKSLTNLDKTKYYLICGYIRNSPSNPALNAGIYLRNYGGVDRATANVSAVSWTFVHMVVSPSDLSASTSSDLRLVVQAGATGQSSNFDGIAIYEITSEEATAITGMTPVEVESNYPYVDDMKHVNAVQITNRGKNLLPPFSEWTSLNAIAQTGIVTSSYELTINATGANQYSATFIPVVPNTTYTLSVELPDGGAVYLQDTDEDKVIISGVSRITTGSLTYTTTANAKYLRVRVDNYTATSGTFVIRNPMLNIGTEALPFEPQKPSYLYLPDGLNLASNPDRSIVDKLGVDEFGKPRVTRRFRQMVLDGSLPWTFDTDEIGFKMVKLTDFRENNINRADMLFNTVKYDGKVLRKSPDYTGVRTSADSALLGSNISGSSTAMDFYVTIADADSGWPESFTPSTDEIKIYFNGWKMCDSAGNAYVSGTKYWKNIVTDGTPASDINYCLNNLASTYTPYRLQYQLAQSVYEAVEYEGELMLHGGPNQVSMGTGIVVREATDPVLVSGRYYIGFTSTRDTLTKRVDKPLYVYKDGEKDLKWVIESIVTGGNQRFYIDQSNYDPTAAYSVTYEALDKYLIGIAPLAITGKAVPNIKEAVDDLTRGLTEAKTQISVLQNVKAQKQQPNWIAPVLLNGWVNFGGTNYNNVGFYKDENGYVYLRGLIKSGTIPSVALILPKGYRSSRYFNIPCISNGALGNLEVRPTGEVRVVSGDNADFNLDGVSFRAEQ